MTKDSYFEMCEMMGSEPVEADIPVEFDDLPVFVQETFNIYSYLSDRWEGMSATFMGKDYNIVFNLFEIFSIDSADKHLMLKIMSSLDRIRGSIIRKKQESKKA